MLTSNWDFSHVEKNSAIYFRLCLGVVVTMKVSLNHSRPVLYGVGSKPFIWVSEECLLSELLKA